MSLPRFLLLIFFLIPFSLYSEESYDYSSKIDWKTGELMISVDVNYTPDSEKLRMRDNSEKLFDEMFFDIFINSLGKTGDEKVYFNSFFSMEDMIQRSPGILKDIGLIKNRAVKVYNVYHQDMSGVKMLYKFNIYRDVVPYFIDHKIPSLPAEKMLWVPADEYTGVVIFAKGEFPVHGESKKGKLNPAVFPSVYTVEMEKILSPEMVSPEYLSKWGTAGYTDSETDESVKERVGDKPLYSMAREIFGRNRTDIVLPSETADYLLYKKRNADLIKEGRFIIICDLP